MEDRHSRSSSRGSSFYYFYFPQSVRPPSLIGRGVTGDFFRSSIIWPVFAGLEGFLPRISVFVDGYCQSDPIWSLWAWALPPTRRSAAAIWIVAFIVVLQCQTYATWRNMKGKGPLFLGRSYRWTDIPIGMASGGQY